jgi:hypothetical protein
MYHLDLAAVQSWNTSGDRYYPGSVSLPCPYCARHTTFRMEGPAFDQVRRTMAASANCPACQQAIHVWCVEPARTTGHEDEKCQSLGIFPAPSASRTPLAGLELLPDNLRKAYRDTLDVYNAGVWRATTTLCRVTLEAIVTDRAPEATGALAERFTALAGSPDLGLPLATLARSLQPGGNLGAQFAETQAADSATATALVSLLEYLLEYLYTLPAQVAHLDRTLAQRDEPAPAPASAAG